MKKSLNETNDIIIATDIDPELNTDHIRADIKKLKWLIKKTSYKIKLYEKSLEQHLLNTKEAHNLEKGLSLYNLLSKHETRI